MKRIHNLIVTLICAAAFAAFSFASLSYGAELPGMGEKEGFDSYDMPDTQTGPEVSGKKEKRGS